jgi:C4-dicarboxylate-specific signal transduction histidine kinase
VDLVRTTKLAALGELVTGVTHEINNPLGALRLQIELLAAISSDSRLDSQLRNEIQTTLQSMDQCVDRMDCLIRGLKQFSRGNEQGVQPGSESCNPNQVIQDVLVLYGKQIRDQNVILELKLSNQVTRALMDPRKLEQVIVNLITNALDAMKGMSKGTDSTWSAPRITLQTELGMDHVRIQIQDSGPGVPITLMDRVFEPFFTTKEVGKGTGLGLSISRQLVESSFGKMFIDPEFKTGALFCIELPLREANA